MKKLFFLFSFCVCFLMANAQKSSTADSPLGYDQTFYQFTTTANATTATDSTWYYTILKESKGPLKYDIMIHLDSIGGTGKRTVVTLQGKVWTDQVAWTSITTKAWTLKHDTTVNLSETSTAKQYRYWQVLVKSDNKGFIFKVDKLYFKFWE